MGRQGLGRGQGSWWLQHRSQPAREGPPRGWRPRAALAACPPTPRAQQREGGQPRPGPLMGRTPGPNLTGLQTHCSDHVPTRKIRSPCFLKADRPGPLRVPGCHWTKPPARLPPGGEGTLGGAFQGAPGSPSTLQVGSLPCLRVPTQSPCSPSPRFPATMPCPPAALAQTCHHCLPPSARPVKSDPSPPASSLALTMAPASTLSLHCPPHRAEIEPSSSSPA